jgi:diguanylate cyclase (GGDEF)-like protein
MEGKKTDSPLYDLVRAEKMKLLFDQSYAAIFVSLLSCALLSVILLPAQQKEVLISWVLILVASALARFMLFMLYNRMKPQGKDILAWERPYFLTLILSSMAWGIGALYIMPIGSQLHQIVIYFFLMGMSGGAVTVYSANRTMTLVSIACLLLPITTWFIVQGNLLVVGTAIGAVIFTVNATRTGKILSLILNHRFMLTHELKKAKEAAEALALKDELSGLNNRRAFYEKGKMLVDYCQRNDEVLSAIIIDIDHFKKINDRFGHAAGDVAIFQIGYILQRVTRKSDLCARIGGEEFVILLKASVTGGATQLAEKLRQMIAGTPIVFNGEDFSISASFGVAVGNADLNTLLKRADAALYKAKEMGRNRVVCDGRAVEKTQGQLRVV